MAKSKTTSGTGRTSSTDKEKHQTTSNDSGGKATRETIESIVIAIVLAFLVRTFVVEAFIIPTGSMAPTLQGRHMDVQCEKCTFQYRTGASSENDSNGDKVVRTTCPICRYTMELNKQKNPNQRSFSGDRIIVSKFAYELQDPERWDVIVFKYPGNAKQNYIKRLVGLPDETLRIRYGDIYVGKTPSEDQPATDFQIARKSPGKLKAMLQLVDDSHYRPAELSAVGWPPRWQDWQSPDAPTWQRNAGGEGFQTVGKPNSMSWLRYRHVVPWDSDWDDILRGQTPLRLQSEQVVGQLVADYYAYNDDTTAADAWRRNTDRLRGTHWVGDLAVECDLRIEDSQGRLALDLVEGGVHHTCTIDVATGQAELSLHDQQRQYFFQDADGTQVNTPKCRTRVRGAGKYHLRFANCDNQLTLWVNDRVAEFKGPTTFAPLGNDKPKWSPTDAGDLEPVGIGADGVGVNVTRLKVYRDIYYVADTWHDAPGLVNDYSFPVDDDTIHQVFTTPSMWKTTSLFDRRRTNVEFVLKNDQYFPLGDNSPASKDARLWPSGPSDPQLAYPHPYVERRLLTGKALVIYWPHPWRRPVPFTPNLQRMGLIR